MKIFTVAFLILISFISIGQTEDESVSKIRKWFKATEANLESCVQVKLNDWEADTYYSGYTPEFIGFYDTTKNELIKVDRYGAADWHELWTSYYFKDGKLFFIFERGYTPGEMYTAKDLGITEEELWERGQDAKTCEAFETRAYYVNDKVVRYLKKEQEVSVESKIKVSSEVKSVKKDVAEANAAVEIQYTKQFIAMLKKSM